MRTVRRSRPKSREPRDVRLWMPPDAWCVLERIAEHSECSVAEVIETALDDWAEGTFVAAEALAGQGLVGIGSFDLVTEERK